VESGLQFGPSRARDRFLLTLKGLVGVMIFGRLMNQGRSNGRILEALSSEPSMRVCSCPSSKTTSSQHCSKAKELRSEVSSMQEIFPREMIEL
jgi:hypothetical protein